MCRRQLHRDLGQAVRGGNDTVKRVSTLRVPHFAQYGVELTLQLGDDVCPAEAHVHEPVGKAQSDVELIAEEVAQRAAFIVHRGDEEQVPERLAVASVVDDPFNAALPGVQAGADPGRRVRVGSGALQEAAVAAHRFGGTVARYRLEGRVDRHHGAVRQVRVGQHHG